MSRRLVVVSDADMEMLAFLSGYLEGVAKVRRVNEKVAATLQEHSEKLQAL